MCCAVRSAGPRFVAASATGAGVSLPRISNDHTSAAPRLCRPVSWSGKMEGEEASRVLGAHVVRKTGIVRPSGSPWADNCWDVLGRTGTPGTSPLFDLLVHCFR